jgi:hypothetical protein
LKKEKANALGVFVEYNEMSIERSVNKSVEAPVDGVYRYELIPAEKPVDYYIDLWYQFSMGMDTKRLLTEYNDAVYLEKGDCVVIQDDVITVKKKEHKLKLVVNNDG